MTCRRAFTLPLLCLCLAAVAAAGSDKPRLTMRPLELGAPASAAADGSGEMTAAAPCRGSIGLTNWAAGNQLTAACGPCSSAEPTPHASPLLPLSSPPADPTRWAGYFTLNRTHDAHMFFL